MKPLIKKLALMALILSLPLTVQAQSAYPPDPMRIACAKLLEQDSRNPICNVVAAQPYGAPAPIAPVYGALVADSSGILHPFYGTYERCLSVYTARKVSLETNGVKNVPLPEEMCLPAR